LNPDFDPDRDFIPPFTEERAERMSLGVSPSSEKSSHDMRSSF